MTQIDFERQRIKFEPFAVRVFKKALRDQFAQALVLLPHVLNEDIANLIGNEYLVNAYKKVYLKVGGKFARLQIKELTSTKGLSEDAGPYIDQRIADYIERESLRRIATVTANNKEDLRRIIRRALTEGLSILDTVRIIKREIPSIIKYKAERIARTEIVSVSNAASLIGADTTGLNYNKIWLAHLDSRTRDTHVAAHNQIVPKNSSFKVGGISLRYPGDPAGTPDETVNCRCAIGYDL